MSNLVSTDGFTDWQTKHHLVNMGYKGFKLTTLGFDSEEDAMQFASVVANNIPATSGTLKVAISKIHAAQFRGSYVAYLALKFGDVFSVEGFVSRDSKSVCLLESTIKGVQCFPLKTPTLVVWAYGNSEYIRFEDGSAFCRSADDDSIRYGSELHFSNSYKDTEVVRRTGGPLSVCDMPTIGGYPMYVYGGRTSRRAEGDCGSNTRVFEPESFLFGGSIIRAQRFDR